MTVCNSILDCIRFLTFEKNRQNKRKNFFESLIYLTDTKPPPSFTSHFNPSFTHIEPPLRCSSQTNTSPLLLIDLNPGLCFQGLSTTFRNLLSYSLS